MNPKLYNRIVEFATSLKPQKQSGEKFHVAVASRKNRIICVGWNDYNKPHNPNRFGEYHSNKFNKNEYSACKHAEISLIIRLGEENLDNYDVTVVRIDNNGKPNMSRPCVNCARVLRSLNVNKMFYSDENGECRVME
jgi:deoxycytidylate deaminase